uniref:Uncharacterized protein n=1 Tax=Cacopsylla melanoneura TaxID=428564 RepID=A0A8D9BYU8_9HEMI
MSIKLFDLFSIVPIQENIVKYLSADDLKQLSSLGGQYEDFYFEFNRELVLSHYDDEIFSKFTRIEKLTLTNRIQKEIIPEDKLSVLLSLQTFLIDKEKINLRESIRLQTLKCNNLQNINSEHFPVSLKNINFFGCKNISNINLKHI